MNPDAALTSFRLQPGVSIAQAHHGHQTPVTMSSPALAVMTDLTQVKAATIHPTISLQQAEQMMIYLGVRMLFVVSDMPAFEGLITATDLRGDRPLRVVHERNVHHDELVVGDVMTALSELEAVALDSMRTASVGNAVATFKRFGLHHLLVVQETAPGTQCVCGVISRAQIERQLGTTIEVTPIASNFAEIERVLA